MQRISISLSEEELDEWNTYRVTDTMSGFIRNAVNEYIKGYQPEDDIIGQLRIRMEKMEQDFTRKTNSIEGDLIDLTATMAKFGMIDFDPSSNEWKIKKTN